MTYIGPFNYQAIYESDVWNVFHSLGLGYHCFLITPVNGKTLWMIPPRGTEYSQYHKDAKVIQELIEKGLAAELYELPGGHPQMAEKAYALTEEGKELAAELSELSFQEGQVAFVEKVRPVKK